MADSVSSLGFSCMCRTEKHHGNTKQVQMNSFHAFGGGLTQGINGKSVMRGYG